MSNGRFFRLNQSLSKVVDGVTIFDYIEVAAYEGLEKPMSPKYPISMIIDADSVKFRLHYCAYRDGAGESPEYQLSIGEFTRAEPKLGLAHMGEVILELPYVEKASLDLTDVIKGAYLAKFPTLGGNEVGSRYFDQLIKSEKGLQGRKEEASYSTLWLMDMSDKNGIIDLYNNSEEKVVVKFLRKLILDFMFDMKHSDVFCVSKNYDRMYTGLMSNFFFSSLMHKCEFYYYRTLVENAVEWYEKEKEMNKQHLSEKKDELIYLYGKELFDAQAKWINDIMNPMSETCFEHDFPKRSTMFRSIIFEIMSGLRWPSWFATPEEEMRRVHFSVKEWNNQHNCNARTLVEYLSLEKEQENHRDSAIICSMLESEQENRVRVSQWFLDRFDFNDVVHLHVFKHLNVILFALTLVFFFLLFIGHSCGIDTVKGAFEFVMTDSLDCYHLMGAVIVMTLVLGFVYFYVRHDGTCLTKINNRLYSKRLIVLIIVSYWFVTFTAKVLQSNGIVDYISKKFNELFFNEWSFNEWSFNDWIFGIVTVVGTIYLFCKWFWCLGRFRLPSIHPIKSSHLFLPKLVASITTAWLTLLMGFDVFIAFYDRQFSAPIAFALTVVVFGFIMSRINRTIPTSDSILRSFRALEFLLISYCISFVIGLFVINFVADRYIARHGHTPTFYDLELYNSDVSHTNAIGSFDVKELHKFIDKYVENRETTRQHDDTISGSVMTKGTEGKLSPIIGRVESMTHVRFSNDTSYYMGRLAIRYHIPNTNHDLFILPKFLVMFSFFAMFIGIFLQMVFFDRKQMTDF